MNESGNQSDEDSETVNQHAERSSPVLDDDSSASHCPDVHSSKQEVTLPSTIITQKLTNDVVQAIHSSNIKDICSETQRLARKSSLSLPYHKAR